MEEDGRTSALVDDASFASSFRSILHGGRRRGVRLERVYWRVLKALASERGRTQAQIVAEIAGTPEGARNLASALRVACTGWLERQLSRQRVVDTMRTVETIVKAAPAPAFAITEAPDLVVVNRAFANMAHALLPGAGSAPLSETRLVLDRPIAQVLERFRSEPHGVLTVDMMIRRREARREVKANLFLAPVTGRTLLVGFIAEMSPRTAPPQQQ